MNIYKNPAFPNGAAVFQSTSKHRPVLLLFGSYFRLFSQSCFVEECRPGPAVCPIPAQLCWSNAPVPDMLAPASRRHPFTPTRTLGSGSRPASSPLLPSCGGEERSNRRSESPLVIRHCHSGRVEGSKPRPLLASADALWRNEDTLLSKHSRNLCNEERAAWLDENEYKPTQRLSSVTPQVYITVNKSLTVSGKSRKLRWWTLNTSADIFQRFKKLQHFEILSKKKKSCSLN